jgi:hypothetical protein
MINTDNLTTLSVDRAIESALAAFRVWECRVDLSNPSKTDDLYRQYQRKVQHAQQIARIVNWRVGDADNLP